MTQEAVEKQIQKLLKDNDCGFEILYQEKDEKKVGESGFKFKIKVKKIK